MRGLKALTLVLAMAFGASALGATTLELPARKVKASGDGDLPTLIDLGAEIKKKNPKLDLSKSPLSEVRFKAKAGPTGAIYALVLNGAAVDSATVSDDKETSVTLVPDTSSPATPWVLGVRGNVSLESIRVTLGGTPSAPGKDTPTAPTPAPAPPQTPAPAPAPAPTPTPPPPKKTPTPTAPSPAPVDPARSDEDLIGRKVIVVSRTTGRIDYAQVVKKDRDGTFRVLFQGLEYEGFARSQIALTEGCSANRCINDGWSKGQKIKGRLPGGRFVVETAQGELRVVGTSDRTEPAPSGSNPKKVPFFESFTKGDPVYYVDGNSDAHQARVTKTSPDAIWIRLAGQNKKELKITDASGLGAAKGCSRDFCVGDQVRAADESGEVHRAEVLALQDEDYVVLRVFHGPWDIGHWPAEKIELDR